MPLEKTMFNRKRIVKFVAMALAMAFLLGGPVQTSAQDVLSPRAWQNDIETMENKVMEALRIDFESYDFPPSWRVYRDDFLDGIRDERQVMHNQSYQIIRDVMLTLSQDFESLVVEGNWEQAERYLYTKLDLISNILSLTDDGGF
jgi:putative AlgH/UPF0301 family transcriptional regulator